MEWNEGKRQATGEVRIIQILLQGLPTRFKFFSLTGFFFFLTAIVVAGVLQNTLN